jgi:hypothetical protein
MMSAFPPKADMDQHEFDVRYVPDPDFGRTLRTQPRKAIQGYLSALAAKVAYGG